MGNRRCISALGYEDGKSVNILWGKILWVWKFLLILHSQSGLDALVAWHGECENSSVGRARPCQGRGRGFEARFSLEDLLKYAKIAQLVEHDLAKVGVAGSSPVFRSKLEH